VQVHRTAFLALEADSTHRIATLQVRPI